MKKIIFSLLFLFTILCAQAAYLTNVPRVLIQPNGDTLRCFASGDEFYLRLHDADNFTIVQDPQTGYFVYAMLQNEKVVPSQWVAGTCNPAQKGLRPNISISPKQYQQNREKMLLPAKRTTTRDENTNKGNYNNIAIFIRFADDTNFTNSFSSIELMFNDSSDNYQANSMFDYFKRTSYNQLFIRTYLYPAPDGERILSYQDSLPRTYFQPWSETNPIGYRDNDSTPSRTEREHQLLDRACRYIDSLIPYDINFDYNNDGNIDNVCFIVRGNVGDWSTLLWPHRWSLYTTETYIHGKRVYDYNLQLADAEGSFNPSVLCHEMFHSLGAPDLYHYSYDGFDAVGQWDLMCSNQNPPQQTCAYMKYKYGNWLTEDDIIPVTEYGTYTIKPLNCEQPDRVCYRFNTQSPYEFIMADYRNRKAPFDEKVPGAGVVFYRVNVLFNGNASYNGEDVLDEVYVFRMNGNEHQNGNISNAYFRGNIARNEFSPLTNPYPFISDGQFVPLHIVNFTTGSDSLQFDYTEWVSVTDYEEGSISAYPNPTNNLITITNTLQGSFNYQIFNVQGQLLDSKNTSDTHCSFNVGRYPAGYYFIKIFEDQKYYKTLKFVKQ